MQGYGSAESVIAAIRDEAAAEVERVERAASAEVEKLRVVEPFVICDREQRLGAARRETRERIAQEEWQGRRAAIEQRELWIARVLERGRELLASHDVQPLIDDAIAHLPAGPYEISKPPCGGVIVVAGDVAFDNSFDARSRRLEQEWRKVIAALYEVTL
jgi:vacuolar-type H+-ATPase subunit E/Vma4